MPESDRYDYQEVIFELHMLEASSRQGSHSSRELMQVCQLIQSHQPAKLPCLRLQRCPSLP